MKLKIVVLAVAAALVALGGYLYYERASQKAEPAQAEAPAPAAVETPPQVEYPVPADDGAEAIEPPPLDDSDAAMLDSLVAAFGEAARELLVPDLLVRRIVATIDGLAQKKLAVRMRPVRPAPGQFVTQGEGESLVIGANNYARYAPVVRLVEGVDVTQLVELYFRFYPRFQQAYEQLGYPSGYFNDRLVAVIDDLLDAPDIEAPIALVHPKVQYEFADPDLEGRSVGQKLLLRMGPDHATVIKSKLRQIRIEVTGHAPPR